MKNSHSIIPLMALVAIPQICVAQILHFSRAQPNCCLPRGYGYSAFTQSDTVTAVSFSGVPVTRGGSASTLTTSTTTTYPDGRVETSVATKTADTVQVKSFPLRVRNLDKDHCRLSRVAVLLSSDGTWSIDFLAEQNPNILPADERPRVLSNQQNQFHVRVRPLVGERLSNEDGLDAVAVPSVACLHVQSFWLPIGAKRQIRAQGKDENVRRNFDTIGHVAVDLTYR